MKRIGILTVVALWATVAQAATILDDTFNAEAAGVSFEEMHQAVSAGFGDPKSAQYKELVVYDHPKGNTVVCGWVNARNSGGGYTEFYPFFFVVESDWARVGEDYLDPTIGEVVQTNFRVVGCKDQLRLPNPL